MQKYMERDFTDLAVTFYKSGKWIIEVIESSKEYEYWLGYENYCVKDMVFCVDKDDHSFDEFVDLIACNLYHEKISFAFRHDQDVFEIW